MARILSFNSFTIDFESSSSNDDPSAVATGSLVAVVSMELVLQDMGGSMDASLAYVTKRLKLFPVTAARKLPFESNRFKSPTVFCILGVQYSTY